MIVQQRKIFPFLTDIAEKNIPQNSMDTTQGQAKGQSLQPKTRAVNLPLIDLSLAKYDTMLTSMLKVKRLT